MPEENPPPSLYEETAKHLQQAAALAKGEPQREFMYHLTAALCWEITALTDTLYYRLDDIEDAVSDCAS